jgi:tRNA pseudouridine13 synthase
MGNRFALVIRDLGAEAAAKALAELGEVRRRGYENYFDDQRFGSFDERQGFIAEKILLGHFNGALRIYLTHSRAEERADDRERKGLYSAHWGDWDTCREIAASPSEKEIFAFLRKEPKGFLPVLQRISREEMSLFFSAYQSFLWNEVLRRMVAKKAGMKVMRYAGTAGAYLFCGKDAEEVGAYLRALEMPMPAARAHMPDGETAGVYHDLLAERGIKPSSFNMRQMRQAFFKSTPRSAFVVPADLSGETAADDIYRGKSILRLCFVLQRGSYATMLVKRIFSDRTAPGAPETPP